MWAAFAPIGVALALSLNETALEIKASPCIGRSCSWAVGRRGITSPVVQRLSGLPDTRRYYAAVVLARLATGPILGIPMLLRGPLALMRQQPYGITALAALLIRYDHDHVLSTRPESIAAEVTT